MQMTEEEICKRFKRNGCYKGPTDEEIQGAVDFYSHLML